jgi:hypothetical protein
VSRAFQPQHQSCSPQQAQTLHGIFLISDYPNLVVRNHQAHGSSGCLRVSTDFEGELLALNFIYSKSLDVSTKMGSLDVYFLIYLTYLFIYLRENAARMQDPASVQHVMAQLTFYEPANSIAVLALPFSTAFRKRY